MSLDDRKDPSALGRESSWSGVRAVVTGLGASGYAAADTLQHLGADVIVVDHAIPEGRQREQATLLEILGVDVRMGPDAGVTFGDVDLVVTSPGWPPSNPLLVDAAAHGVPVWGEVELAWRLRGPDAAPWLAVTGTNGKTTTVQMLDAILKAEGLRSDAVGNVGRPVLEAVMDPEPYDVLAVELSSYQLHWSSSISCQASVVLNVEPDHLDWHGDEAAYAAAKGRIYENTQVACVYNVQDEVTEQLVMDADVVEGCRAIGFTLAMPGPSMIGMVEDVIADRAFVADRHTSAAELGTLADLERDGVPAAPHVVADALAAAALARAHGVSQRAVREGLRGFRLDAHRMAFVTESDGIRWIDDSKATNVSAARAALRSTENVVWVAGGLAKGASYDDLVLDVRERLRGVVLIGRDRGLIAEALRRHAPDVPVIEVDNGETDLMDAVARTAASLAREGDTVLLAPAAASMDQFRSYAHRGEAFAAAARRLTRT
ncbi:UDP-N-acetylmuramoyl-L-alanine--D-glutamate ligase [Aeromicrobium alkaliterrae]|uniref:UDP-N-acetylmuramoylalanine--D-glutamate ligase n=1 Tax=Aeromicrobium alkaliterrae TaxID=302168 RepID=A0ABN2JN50_9ACTN